MKVRFFELLDQPYMVQRVMFIWMLILFSYSIWWMFDFAKTSPRPGVEVAAIIGAINAPLCFLFGAILSFWNNLRNPPVPPAIIAPPANQIG